MLTKIKLGFGALSVMLLVGCGGQVQGGDVSATQDAEDSKEDSARRVSHPEYYKCAADTDCVAIEKAGCCPNGYLVAVNQHEVKAYDKKYACTESAPICPLFVVKDTRVAQCDGSAHQCQMIDPTEIRCGGFVPTIAHVCPTGFSCEYGASLDVPGTCVANPQ